MAMNDEDGCDRDDRTLYVGGLSEKMTESILYELFFQAGPIERVAIPKEKDSDRIKTFGFVTYKHLSSVPYALNIFAGTKLFGKDLQLRNRNASRNRDAPQQFNIRNPTQPPTSLLQGYGGNFMANDPALFIQQQLLQMATGQAVNLQSYVNAGAQMFDGSIGSYASTRTDSAGSHRDHFVDRSRYHREENRSNRSKPYRRSRSRSPAQPYQSRDRSPDHGRNRGGRNNDRPGRRSDEKGYHRWGKR